MLGINIAGFKELRLAHLVLDYNGTIAAHGRRSSRGAGEVGDPGPRLAIPMLDRRHLRYS